jgi:hypothetical protein
MSKQAFADELMRIAYTGAARVVPTTTQGKMLAGATAATMAAFPALYAGYRATKKQREFFAPGIPKERKIETPRSPRAPTAWRMVVQHHPARRAGNHHDLRLGDPVTGQAHSWATKKDIPGPGDPPIAVYQQPTHTYDYLNFEGELKKGYGRTKKGQKVKAIFDEPAQVMRVDKNFFRFNTETGLGTEKFVLVKKKDGGEDRGNTWFLINVTGGKRKEKKASVHNVFSSEMQKIAQAGYKKRRGVLVDKDIPILRSLPKTSEGATKALMQSVQQVKSSTWSHPQVAVPVAAAGDLRRLGFKVDPGFAIPLPGEKWFSKTWRKGKLHAHRRGPYYLIHADKSPGMPSSLKGLVSTAKHIVQDVPPALYKRLMGTARRPVILKTPGKR